MFQMLGMNPPPAFIGEIGTPDPVDNFFFFVDAFFSSLLCHLAHDDLVIHPINLLGHDFRYIW